LKLKVLLGILISGIFVYLSFRDVNFQEMLVALKGANYFWLLPVFFFMLTSHWLRAARWRYFLKPIKDLQPHPCFSALMIGYAANNILPLRLGEFLRAFAIGKSQNIPKSSAFATIIVERLIDLLSLLVLLASMVLLYPLPDMIKNSGYLIFALTVGAIVFLIFLMEKTEATINLLQKILPAKLFQFVQKVVRAFLQGFVVLKKSEHYFRIVLYSVLIWALYAAVVYVSFFAFKLNEEYGLNLLSSVVVLVIVTIGIMIPSSPGFVGTYHWFCMQSLALYGVPQSEALSFAVISHAMNTIPYTIIGLVYFWKENLRFSDAVAEKQLVEHEMAEKKFKMQSAKMKVKSEK